MTIALPGTSKQALLRLFGRKSAPRAAPAPQKPLSAQEVAKLFTKRSREVAESQAEPVRLNETEKRERETLSSLRGALYSKN